MVVMFLAILFMLARMMKKMEWEAFVRTELSHLLVSIFWVIAIAAFASVACISACLLSNGENPFDTAISYLSSMREKIETRIDAALEIAKAVRLESSQMLGLTEGGPFIRPYEGCSIIANNQETLSMVLFPFVASIIAQQFFLLLVSTITFQFILPIGVVLRILPYVRETGALLMALSVSLYIVFPLTYVMASTISADVLKDYDTLIQGFEKEKSVGVSGLFLSSSMRCLDPTPLIDNLKAVAYVIPQAVFFPALSAIITIACARTLTKVFMYDFAEMF